MLRRLHALSVTDRLIRWGMSRPRAQAIGCWWERRIHPVLYGSHAGIGACSHSVTEISSGKQGKR